MGAMMIEWVPAQKVNQTAFEGEQLLDSASGQQCMKQFFGEQAQSCVPASSIFGRDKSKNGRVVEKGDKNELQHWCEQCSSV